jgi:hypothetical protein
MPEETVQKIIGLLQNSNQKITTFRINSVGHSYDHDWLEKDGDQYKSGFAIWGQLICNPEFVSNDVRSFELMVCEQDSAINLYLDDIERCFPNIQNVSHSSQFSIWADVGKQHKTAFVERLIEPTKGDFYDRVRKKNEYKEIDFWTGQHLNRIRFPIFHDSRIGQRRDHQNWHNDEKPTIYNIVGELNCDVPYDLIVSGRRFSLLEIDGKPKEFYATERNAEGVLKVLYPALSDEDKASIDVSRYKEPESDYSKNDYLSRCANKIIYGHFDPIRLQTTIQRMGISLDSMPYSGHLIAPLTPEQYPPHEEKPTFIERVAQNLIPTSATEAPLPAWKKWLIPAAIAGTSFIGGCWAERVKQPDSPPKMPAMIEPAQR